MMQDDLVGRLLAAPSLAALVGTGIYWLTAPQDAGYPRITMQAISEFRDQNYKGLQPLQQARIQFDVWAEHYADAQCVADTLLAAVLPATTFGDTKFRRAMIDRSTDFFERGSNQRTGATQQIFRKSVDLMIWHSAA